MLARSIGIISLPWKTDYSEATTSTPPKNTYRGQVSHTRKFIFDEISFVSATGLASVLDLTEQAGLSHSLSTMTEESLNQVVTSRTLFAGMLAGADSIYDLYLLRARTTGETHRWCSYLIDDGNGSVFIYSGPRLAIRRTLPMDVESLTNGSLVWELGEVPDISAKGHDAFGREIIPCGSLAARREVPKGRSRGVSSSGLEVSSKTGTLAVCAHSFLALSRQKPSSPSSSAIRAPRSVNKSRSRATRSFPEAVPIRSTKPSPSRVLSALDPIG